MRILLTLASFSPAYGGPARSVSRLAKELVRFGSEVGVWAPDGSTLDSPFLGMQEGLRLLTGTVKQAIKDFNDPDVLHDNGIWWAHNHQLASYARKFGIPFVISTRGMLEPWAMRHKRLAKTLAWWLYQRKDLCTADCHHVTSSAEANHVKSFGWKVPIREIPNGIDIPVGAQFENRAKPTENPRVALFVGRIYPVKGLPMLVKAWQQVRPFGWKMKIVGPDQAGHRAEVEANIHAAGLTKDFEFKGPLDGLEKKKGI